MDLHLVEVVDHMEEVVVSYSADAMYGAVLNSLPREHYVTFRFIWKTNYE